MTEEEELEIKGWSKAEIANKLKDPSNNDSIVFGHIHPPTSAKPPEICYCDFGRLAQGNDLELKAQDKHTEVSSNPQEVSKALREAIDTIFYRNQMEHLIQDEPNYGFCETCQEMKNWRCDRANKYLPYAKKDILALLNKAQLDLIDKIESELPVHKALTEEQYSESEGLYMKHIGFNGGIDQVRATLNKLKEGLR